MGTTWVERQMEKRKSTCDILLARYKRKSFLHRTVTRDKNWMYFENSKRKNSWVGPGAPSTSTARPNRFGRKTMLRVWWNHRGVISYELLKLGETVNTKCYQQQLTDLNRSLFEKKGQKVTESKEATQSHVSSWQSFTYDKIGLQHVRSTQLRSFT